ncbi:MAG: DUF4249 domain-containing protein [Bacteroidetes bacterium]|nr:DUF4249 domain-containing protein [Bacteroidota bacterium]
MLKIKVIAPIFCILTGLLLLSSCEKNITVDLPDVEQQLVVEGYIYQDTFPYIFLTKSSPFFDELDSAAVQAYVVRGATVIISDGFTTDTMDEFENGFFHVYYSLNMRGVAGRSYSLRIEADGMKATASTYLPHAIALDSVWWKPDGNKDTLGFAWAHLTDPDTIGNYYRWFAKRINRYTYGDNIGEQKDFDFIAPLGSTFEDRFINGKSFDFGYNRGQLNNSTKEDDGFSEERGYFKKGDTIVVKFCTYDQANFNFWRDAENQIQSNGNPFSNPSPIFGNIDGGLGVFGGYGVSYDTIVAR